MNTIDKSALAALDRPTLIDVREVVEYVAGHAQGVVAFNMLGGTSAWRAAGRPLTTLGN